MEARATRWDLLQWLGYALCTGLGGYLAFAAGAGLVGDAYFAASHGGADRFFDTASRVALPFVELGILSGVIGTTLADTHDVQRTLAKLSAIVWACAMVNLLVFLFVDHPLWFIGL